MPTGFGRTLVVLVPLLAGGGCKVLAPEGSSIVIVSTADSLAVNGDTATAFILVKDVAGQILDGDAEVLVVSELLRICRASDKVPCDPAITGRPIVRFNVSNGQAELKLLTGERSGVDTITVNSGGATGSATIRVYVPAP